MSEEMTILTEVGNFGELNIEDPTVKKVKKKKTPNLDKLIEESINNNRDNLIR